LRGFCVIDRSIFGRAIVCSPISDKAIRYGLGAVKGTGHQAIDAIDFEDGFYRRDIGWRELERTA